MKWAALLLLALAPAPARAAEGVSFGLEAGYGFWSLDHARVARQVPTGDTLLTRVTKNGFVPHVRLGYNILGHLAIEAFFTGVVWQVAPQTEAHGPKNGGAGFVGGEITYYPFQALLPPDRLFDLGLTFGGGYTIMGHEEVPEEGVPATGADGLAWPLGMVLEVYPASFISLGLVGRWVFLGYDRFIFNYNQIDRGGAVRMPEGTGGGLFTLTFSVAFHIATIK